LTDLQTIIIDEADVILNMGFQDDIEEIYSILNENMDKQSI
jgi:superfamily II DNA/RNA helicase